MISFPAVLCTKTRAGWLLRYARADYSTPFQVSQAEFRPRSLCRRRAV